MIDFDYPCSITFRLAEAELNGETINPNDYLTKAERDSQEWVERAWAEVEKQAREWTWGQEAPILEQGKPLERPVRLAITEIMPKSTSGRGVDVGVRTIKKGG